MVGISNAPVIFQRLRRRGNQLLFSPPPEPSHPFLLKKSWKEKQKRRLKENVFRTPEGFGNLRLMLVSKGWKKAFHSFL